MPCFLFSSQSSKRDDTQEDYGKLTTHNIKICEKCYVNIEVIGMIMIIKGNVFSIKKVLK